MTKEKHDDSLLDLDVDNVLSKTEMYIEENKQKLTTIVFVVLGVVGLILGYKFIYIAGEEESAAKEMFKAEQLFNRENFEGAINGDPANNVKGFTEIADQYGMTKSGNLAEYYLGISLLRTGKYQEAIEHLEAFDGADQIVGPMATGAIGDAYMEMQKVDEAITYYLKAAEQNVNSFNSPVFLKKAALANEEKASYPVAVQLYERIKNEFPETDLARDMDKYIARAKTLGNIE